MQRLGHPLFDSLSRLVQEYDNRKRFEHAYKSIREDGNSISAVNPKRYSQRFQDFMKMAFV